MIQIRQPKDRRIAYRNPLFTVVEESYVSPVTGDPIKFYLLDGSDWINIIPITHKKQIVFVRQYRYGAAEWTLELPGGSIEENESPVEAARRELMEETGYKTNSLLEIGCVSPNPAIHRNRCHTFLAENIQQSGKPVHTPAEQTEVELIAPRKIPALIRNHDITHTLTISAFYWYALHCKQIG